MARKRKLPLLWMIQKITDSALSLVYYKSSRMPANTLNGELMDDFHAVHGESTLEPNPPLPNVGGVSRLREMV
jgi:hypothetical protein